MSETAIALRSGLSVHVGPLSVFRLVPLSRDVFERNGEAGEKQQRAPSGIGRNTMTFNEGAQCLVPEARYVVACDFNHRFTDNENPLSPTEGRLV